MSDSSLYTEFPGDEIIAVHFKKKSKPPGGEPPDYGGECGSGWFPFGGYFPGGDGFPPQITSGMTDMTAGWGVLWNPEVTPSAPEDAPWMFTIPGQYCKSETISIVWRGVLAPGPGAGPPLLAGLWIMPPEHRPFPPYLDHDGNPPPNPPPYDPDISGEVIGDGRISWTGDGYEPATVVAGFAATAGGPATRVAKSPPIIRPRRRITMPRFPATRADEHYGWPGDPPDDGIWIEVEHDCTHTPFPPA